MKLELHINVSLKLDFTGYPQTSVQQLVDLLYIVCTSVELVETIHSFFI